MFPFPDFKLPAFFFYIFQMIQIFSKQGFFKWVSNVKQQVLVTGLMKDNAIHAFQNLGLKCNNYLLCKQSATLYIMRTWHFHANKALHTVS